jgi:hypothetical protein
MSVSNHTSRPGTFEDLRHFLIEHAGQLVAVEIDAPRSMDCVPILTVRGVLKYVTPEDHERHLQWLDYDMAASGYEGFEDRDHTEDLAWHTEHYADFEIVNRPGATTAPMTVYASMTVHDMDVRNVVIGRIGHVEEYRDREIVVTRHYATFAIEVMRWDTGHPDEDGTPSMLPSQSIAVRVEQWVEQPIEQALREVPA